MDRQTAAGVDGAPFLVGKKAPMRFIYRPFFCILILFAGSWAAADHRQVIVGVHQSPPVIFTDDQGRVKGIAVDLLLHIAEQEHWDLAYLSGSWAECLQYLQNGTIDLMVGVSAPAASDIPVVLGTETFATNWGQLFLGFGTPFSDLLNLHGQRVAGVAGDAYFQFFRTVLEELNIQALYLPVAGYGDVLALVDQHQAFAGVVPRLYGAYHENHYQVRHSGIAFMPVELRFAVAEGRDAHVINAVDRHLKILKQTPDSIIYQSLARWTQGQRQATRGFGLRPLWGLGIVAAAMGLIVVGNVILRRQVKLRTEALKTTIAEKERIESELAVAREIQLQLVPGDFPALATHKGLDIYASLEPAHEVGGDFYDYFTIDRDSLCLVIGDVSGKGVPAALFMAMTKTMLRAAARLLEEPEYILADVNREMAANNPSLTFVTVFLAVLALDTGRLTYCSAGHNPPLFVGTKGNSVLLGEAQCPALGLEERSQYRQATVQLGHGDGLVLFTDGVIEALDDSGHPFTQERLMHTVSLTAGLTAKERVSAILSQVIEFAANRPIDDDLTLLALTHFSPDRPRDVLKTLVLTNDIREMSRIIEAINQVADAVACHPAVLHDVILAMEEIFSNIIFYGFGDDLSHTITLDIVIEDQALVLTLQDEGIPFNPLNVHVGPPDKPLEERDQGGMGIFLAKNLMDKMAYHRERGKNVLRMEKRYR